MIDDESTLPPLVVSEEVLPRTIDYASASGDFRYHHTSLTVAHLVDGWEVAMLGQHSPAHFHLERKLAARVAAEVEAVLRRSTSLPRLFDAQGRAALPPVPPPAPESAFYSPFPAICQADDPFVDVHFADSRVVLRLSTPQSSICITVDEAVGAWLHTLLTGSPPRTPPS